MTVVSNVPSPIGVLHVGNSNLPSPQERCEISPSEADSSGHTCVAWESAHITLFVTKPEPLWYLGFLPARRFAALAGNDNCLAGC